ncbi:hypothetical protein LR48_Vigan10g047300 [Vigna angularis]|uniref:Uncharacterized protein n=1 Tax=Phaseolus angularis TaxID=3914 RepID=A0A0L9VHQ3_PHAAN|nr:hypothetical protein LR48_Vigan10g047300 [Vigna angularis]
MYVDSLDMEKVEDLKVGDLVRSKPSLGTRPSYDWNSVGRESLVVVHSVQDFGYLELACCFCKRKWITHYTNVERVPSFKVGHYVRFQTGLVEPRWAGEELKLSIGDPSELDIEQMLEVEEWVRLPKKCK